MSRCVALIAASLLPACGGEILLGRHVPQAEPITGALELTPARLDLDTVPWGEHPDATVLVRNVGTRVVEVDSLRLIADERVYTLIDPPTLPFDVEPGDAVALTVHVQPAASGPQPAVLILTSDADDQTELRVPVSAEATAPALTLQPARVDVGAHPVGCGVVTALDLRSAGTAPLTVTTVSTEGDEAWSAALGLAPPGPVAAGEGRTVEVAFRPDFAGEHTATVRVVSDSPDGDATVTVTGVGIAPDHHTDTFELTGSPREVDVILAVDRSLSMKDDHGALRDLLRALVDQFEDLPADWRMGVVVGDDEPCFLADWFDATTPAWHKAPLARLDTWTDGSWPLTADGSALLTEALLEAVARAGERDLAGACPRSFRRPGAALHVVVVSDDRDKSWGTADVPGSAATGPGLATLLDPLVAYAGDPDLLRVHARVNLGTLGCPTAYGDGYVEAAQATGGSTADLCAAEWVPLPDLVETIWTVQRAFPLSQARPDPIALEVLLDGALVTEGWTYDPDANAVVFTIPPPLPSVVQVAYELLPVCDD